MWLGIIISIVAIAIGLVIAIPRAKEIRAMAKEGKIVPRNSRYAEKGEQFTARVGSLTALRDALVGAGIPCSMEGNVATTVNFSAKNFSARFCKVDFDEPSGIGVFRFEFTKWSMGRYTYVDEPLMNMLMTSVEKAFLKLDPNTGVETYDLSFKTKHSIF